MTGSIRNFENKNFTPKSRIFVSLKVKIPDMTDWHKAHIWEHRDEEREIFGDGYWKV